jgi:TolA-binding protein
MILPRQPSSQRVRFHAALLAALLAVPGAACLAQSAAPSPAESADLAATFNSASAAFAAGNYAPAIAGLEKVLASAPPDSKLESVYFTLGAAYFNLGQYPKALETLRTYCSKYPQGARIAEATYSLGVAALETHDDAGAAAAFKTLEANSTYGEQALLYEGTALKNLGKTDEAICALEKLVANGIRSDYTADGALQLAGLYAQKKQADKAIKLFAEIRQSVGLLDNVAELNVLAIQTGDALLQQDDLPKAALACYRSVFPRAEVIRLCNERIAVHRGEIARQIAAVRADPAHAAQLLATNARLRTALTETSQHLADFQKLPDYEPGLLIRMATCFARLGQNWEAVVVYEELLRRYPNDAATHETALYGLLGASAEAGRLARARELCEQYLKEFPQGPNADAVGYLAGALALRANDGKGAETYFGRALETQPQSTYKEVMTFLVANAQFSLGEYDKAQASYLKYAQEYPQGDHQEESIYRAALCDVFSGAYEKAMARLQDYETKYPNGDFREDAEYRLGVCRYAASLNDEVIADMQAWQKKYGHGQLLGEVLALEADATAAKGDTGGAVDLYTRASEVAATNEVSDYALFAAQKLLQKSGDWTRMTQMLEDFVRAHPDRPSAVTAIYWIGKAEARDGRTDGAKRFVADTIKKYIADPGREGVEPLLTQLATLCVHGKTAQAAPPLAADAPARDGASTTPESGIAAPTVPPATASLAPAASAPAAASAVADTTALKLAPPVDPGAELDALLGGAQTESSAVARARVLFAKSELARLRRLPAVQDQDLGEIATNFRPAELSAPLLAVTGDYLLGKGHPEQAAAIFEELLAAYPKSNQLDYAYNGLGEIAFARKDYTTALRLYTDAVDKAGASAKLKDVTIGRAKTLLALGRLEEAKSVFEQVASTREWRGESTAFAMYSLGDIMRQENKLPEAIAYYQRVYVAYQRFLPWVAKSYIASAECFEKLGKNQEALNTYREMLRNPKLENFSEAGVAREHLQKVGQG